MLNSHTITVAEGVKITPPIADDLWSVLDAQWRSVADVLAADRVIH